MLCWADDSKSPLDPLHPALGLTLGIPPTIRMPSQVVCRLLRRVHRFVGAEMDVSSIAVCSLDIMM